MSPFARAVALLCLLLPAGCGLLPGMSGPDGEPVPANQAQGAIYCYGTLADADCYAQPQAGWEGRLIGYYPPRPAS